MGTVGTEAPLFFCTQGSNEAMTVRALLSPERPLYAMRSLYLMEGRSPETRRVLAERYAHEIADLRPHGPIHMGGFCEGAKVMSEVASLLAAWGHEIGLFLSIDYWFSAPTSFPVLHVWTEAPLHSAAQLYATPEAAFPLIIQASESLGE